MTQIVNESLPDETFCPACGYDLRGSTSSNCPECGWEIDYAKMRVATMPWSHRAEIGRVRAFLRTAYLASARPGMLANEASRPVSFGDAQRFRWVVVALVALPLCAAALIARYKIGDAFDDVLQAAAQGNFQATTLPKPGIQLAVQLGICAAAGLFWWPVPSIGLILFVIGITGVGSYLFHPGWLPLVRQNRAVTLSYYASAPLAFLFIAYALAAVSALMAWYGVNNARNGGLLIFGTVVLLAGVALLLLIGHWIYSSARMLGVTTHCSLTRQVLLAAFQVGASVFLAALTLGVFPAACGLLRILINSI